MKPWLIPSAWALACVVVSTLWLTAMREADALRETVKECRIDLAEIRGRVKAYDDWLGAAKQARSSRGVGGP